MIEIILNDVPVRFPFEPYDVQKNYMLKVIECLQKGQNGVLESPTGTGKTLCLLCASLAWLEMKKADRSAKTLGLAGSEATSQEFLSTVSSHLQAAVGTIWKPGAGCPKVIYSSRTHSQLSQAVKELKKTTYKHMKVAVLASRDQLCVHPEVSKETNNNNKLHMCQARVKARNCYFYNQVEHKKSDGELREGILDLEDLVKLGKKRTFCPYYMSKELRQEADIIFLPYNYLLDPKSRRAHGVELQGNIVILDEAHNVEKMCEEAASLEIRSTDIALCIEEVTQVMKKLQELSESEVCAADTSLLPEDFTAEDLFILKTMFLELEKAIDEIPLPADGSGVTYPGSYMFDFLHKAEVTPNKKGIIVDLLDKLVQYLTTNSTSPFQRKGAGLSKFSELMKVVFSKENFSISYMEFVKRCYKVHINVEEKKKPLKDSWNAPKLNAINSKKGKVLCYWCFNPGFGMKDLVEQGVHCTILTSGTLSPLQSFTSELQIPFPVQLENPHIIKPCQVWVGTVCKGPDGRILNSSYENRSKPEYLNSLGLTVLNLARIIPGGLLVFFPSYPIMKLCQEHWQNTGVWNSLSNAKPVFVEPRSKDGFTSAMEGFYENVRDPALKGASFMAVCRGKVSEGLDFANRNGRAVIITGLPYPPFKDPRVVLKKQYLEEARKNTKTGLTGANWYKLEASRAVNQAIGRVIRHKDDFGAIILCDKRFSDHNFKQELSSWVKPHMKVHESFGTALRDLIQFFRVTKNMFPEPASGDSKRPIKLEYEDPLTPVPANAFQPISSRQVTSEHARVKVTEENSYDHDGTYRTSKPSTLPVQSKAGSKPLFSALEEPSSVLDFNKVGSYCGDNSSCSGRPNASDENVPPKRRKIKLISQSEKNLNAFMSAPSDRADSKAGTSSLEAHSTDAEKAQPQHNDQRAHNQLKQTLMTKYIKEVKGKLSEGEYKRFSESIKTYRQSKDVDSLIATLLSLFSADSQRHPLLSKFAVLLPPDHRKQLESTYQDLVSM